jgi:hypothetical protein
VTKTNAWLSLADRLYEKGKALFDHSDVLESELGTNDPKVVALTLLARTMGNFQASVLLLGWLSLVIGLVPLVLDLLDRDLRRRRRRSASASARSKESTGRTGRTLIATTTSPKASPSP